MFIVALSAVFIPYPYLRGELPCISHKVFSYALNQEIKAVWDCVDGNSN